MPAPLPSAEYYKTYNCKEAFIQKTQSLTPPVRFCRSQEEILKISLCHLHGKFRKFREDFFILPDFFYSSPLHDINIRKLIIFFYKELSTFSTRFSTRKFLFISNTFPSNYHLFTFLVFLFPDPPKIKYRLT
mgnify:FL=1